MNDAVVLDLARRAGIALEWTDYADRPHRVSLDAVRHILAALGLPCASEEDTAHSQRALEVSELPALITTTVGEPTAIPPPVASAVGRVGLLREDGSTEELSLQTADAQERLPPIDTPGYYTLERGEQRVGLAVAPRRCVTVSDIAPGERLWGLAAQIYGLRGAGDCGIGDNAGVMALAKSAASLRADALALSPVHALFAADPTGFSPYSPSNRMFYNPLHADPAVLFGAQRVARAKSDADGNELSETLEAKPLIDWRQSSRLKMAIFLRLFEDFAAHDLAAHPQTELAADFSMFCTENGQALEQHALFEALHAARLQDDPQATCWRDWPEQWRDRNSDAVARFGRDHRSDVLFHCFLQWIAGRSLAATQQVATQAGMRIGLIADLAIGTNVCGSHCWAAPDDMLDGLEIGAPPDLFNANGQNWGLTTFSPRALARRGYAPFLDTIRACTRHAGGVRIDHAMGLMRLWVIPHGAKASEGAYLSYPLDDLLRLLALESHRHRAIVVGEDLGTVPAGFRDRLEAAGIFGMRVLWFERQKTRFIPPKRWPPDAAAMTSTHDLPTVAGWWSGTDIEVRAEHSFIADKTVEQAGRRKDRQSLWRAFRSAKASEKKLPLPADGESAADAAVSFIAATPCRLALLPLEDALALKEQPNLPGTIDQHPNWRRRYRGDAGALLDATDVRNRCQSLARRRP